MVCALMAYIQFALYGIPAIVVHGNSITQERYSIWYTPCLFMNDFVTKIRIREQIELITAILNQEKEEIIVKNTALPMFSQSQNNIKVEELTLF